jgi:hypothetical protein
VQIIADLEAYLPQRKALTAIARRENVQIVAKLDALQASTEALVAAPALKNGMPGERTCFSKGRCITALPVDKGGGGAG